MYDFFNEEAIRINEGFGQDHQIKYFSHYKYKGKDIIDIHYDIARVSGAIRMVTRLIKSDKTTHVDKDAPFFKNIGKYKTKYTNEELAVYAANLREVKERLKEQYENLGGDQAYELAVALKEKEQLERELKETEMQLRLEKQKVRYMQKNN